MHILASYKMAEQGNCSAHVALQPCYTLPLSGSALCEYPRCLAYKSISPAVDAAVLYIIC